MLVGVKRADAGVFSVLSDGASGAPHQDEGAWRNVQTSCGPVPPASPAPAVPVIGTVAAPAAAAVAAQQRQAALLRMASLAASLLACYECLPFTTTPSRVADAADADGLCCCLAPCLLCVHCAAVTASKLHLPLSQELEARNLEPGA